MRQWNPESHAAGPCIHSRGATIWTLEFKTEYEGQKLLAEAGAATEILGAFIYALGQIPADRPIFENRDSRIALIYGTSVYHADHKLHILDVCGSESKTVGNDTLQWAGSRPHGLVYQRRVAAVAATFERCTVTTGSADSNVRSVLRVRRNLCCNLHAPERETAFFPSVLATLRQTHNPLVGFNFLLRTAASRSCRTSIACERWRGRSPCADSDRQPTPIQMLASRRRHCAARTQLTRIRSGRQVFSLPATGLVRDVGDVVCRVCAEKRMKTGALCEKHAKATIV